MNDYLCNSMKKYSIIFLAIFYFVCATGIYSHAHFCGGELSSISYSALHDKHDCGCGEESATDDCCKDVMHFYKVDAHQSYISVKATEKFSIQLSSFYSYYKLLELCLFIEEIESSLSHAPPPFLFAKASKLIVNSVFRI